MEKTIILTMASLGYVLFCYLLYLDGYDVKCFDMFYYYLLYMVLWLGLIEVV